jgi:hypothetical protein
VIICKRENYSLEFELEGLEVDDLYRVTFTRRYDDAKLSESSAVYFMTRQDLNSISEYIETFLTPYNVKGKNYGSH